MYYTNFRTPLCEIYLTGDEKGLIQIQLSPRNEERKIIIEKSWICNPSIFLEEKKQLLEYFRGERKKFSLSLNPQGTIFQKQVWRELKNIPYGKIVTYKQIAEKIGKPTASRAIGAANSKNPLPIIVPCHRVIGSNGKMVGFAYGLDLKEKLIALEQCQ